MYLYNICNLYNIETIKDMEVITCVVVLSPTYKLELHEIMICKQVYHSLKLVQ